MQLKLTPDDIGHAIRDWVLKEFGKRPCIIEVTIRKNRLIEATAIIK